MKPVFKQIVISVVPAAVGLAVIGNVAPAESIQWAQMDNSQPPQLPGQQASTWPPAPAPASDPEPDTAAVQLRFEIVKGQRV